MSALTLFSPAPVIVESAADHTLSLQLTPSLPASAAGANYRLKAKSGHPNPVYSKMGMEIKEGEVPGKSQPESWVKGWKAPSVSRFFK